MDLLRSLLQTKEENLCLGDGRVLRFSFDFAVACSCSSSLGKRSGRQEWWHSQNHHAGDRHYSLCDINEAGVSPSQAVIGRQPRQIGDVIGGSIQSRLAERGLSEAPGPLARQLALRETAKVAMTRLHFSRGPSSPPS